MDAGGHLGGAGGLECWLVYPQNHSPDVLQN